LPVKSSPRDSAAAAGLVAALAARPADFFAVCWRPRALPPALAARLRGAVLRDAALRDEEPLRADELRDPDPVLADELRPDPLRDDELREPDPPRDDELRADDPLRELDERPPDDLRLPPPELRFDSAISRTSLSACARCGRDYGMPTRAATMA
jgi:hypothetical protein